MAPRVEVDGANGVLIEWPDGHQSRFGFANLRAACPCAGCRDQAARGMTVAAGMTQRPEATRLVRVVPVGRYAIGLVWADGHSTGIYSWEYLRERCDCLACRLGRREVQG